MDDARAFLGSYHQALGDVAAGDWPDQVAAAYEPISCLKHTPTKQVYLVADRRTGGQAVLRVSEVYDAARPDPEQDILWRLDRPGIPKSYGGMVKDGRIYLARD
ncbi:MAG: hypothetical protein LBK95_09550 [Bifidobacteriaceae bacterium]|jgi:hypothetical protein|nr:hypothetical protein [Bifidobacteriaceae bacterium]